jgi:hypothetical protein
MKLKSVELELKSEVEQTRKKPGISATVVQQDTAHGALQLQNKKVV